MNNVIKLSEKKIECSCCKKVTLEGSVCESIGPAQSKVENCAWCETCIEKYNLLNASLGGLGQLPHEVDLELMLQSYELSTYISGRLVSDDDFYILIVPKIYQLLALKKFRPEMYEEITNVL